MTNFRSVDMLAGYANVPSANWGVVSQQPRQESLAALDRLMRKMLLGVSPLGILGLVSIWWLTVVITRPLQQLADSAKDMDHPNSTEHIRSVHSWYTEAARIKLALLRGVGVMQEKLRHLNSQAQTDPLTGLLNRKAMNEALVALQAARCLFSVIALDIDHFKKVNDTYGQEIGDLALTTLARVLGKCARDCDLTCRIGGEEFVLLLPDTPIAAAAVVGERLRAEVERIPVEQVGYITISWRVAH